MSTGFLPAAFVRRAARTEDLAARFAWPTTVAFQQTHARAPAAASIRLVRGRALWWTDPGTPPPGEMTLDARIARGQALVRATQEREAEHDRAFEALLAKKIFDDAKHDVLTAKAAKRAKLEGVGRELPEVLLGIRRGVGGEAVEFAWLPGAGSHPDLEGLPAFPTADWLAALDRPFVHVSGQTTFVFVPAGADGTPPDPDARAWEDWTYTTTLLALPRPLYESQPRAQDEDWRGNHARIQRVEEATRRGPAEGLAAIRKAVSQNTRLDEVGWAEVASFAQRHGDIDLALTILSRHQPVGRCSMDRSPATAARRYAEICYAAGKLGCFLNLQVQIMGDQFQRVAYSSYGEASHATEANRLRDIGVDVEKFLRGLLYRFDAPGVERRELDTWRLARSILEANLGAQMASGLRAAAARPDLDAYNRLRAADILASLRYQQGTPGRTGMGGGDEAKLRPALLRQIRAELETLNLPEAVKPWVRSWGE